MSQSGKEIDVKVKATTAGLQTGMQEAQNIVGRSTAYMRENIAGLGSVVERVKIPFAELAAVMAGGELFKETVARADELAISLTKASAKTGLTTAELSKLRYAGQQTDVSFELITRGMQKLSLAMEMTNTPSSLASRAFAALGISATDAGGRLRPIPVVLAEVANKFATMQDGSTKTALAMNLFGRAGADLLPLLNKGAAGIKAYGDEAARLGDVMDAQTRDRIEAYHQAMVRLKAIFEGVAIQVASVLAPVLSQLGNAFSVTRTQATEMNSALTPLQSTARSVASFLIQLTGYATAVGAAFTYVGDTASSSGVVLHDLLTFQFTAAKRELASFSAKLTADAAAIPAAVATMRANLAALRNPAAEAPAGETAAAGPIIPGTTGHGRRETAIKLPHVPDIGNAVARVFREEKQVADQTLQMQRDHVAAGLQLQQQAIDQRRALGQISGAEALRQTRAVLAEEYQAKKAALAQELALAQHDLVKQAEIKRQLQALEDQHTAAMQQNSNATVLAIKAQWEGVFSAITNAVQTSVQGIIQGTQTLSGAIRQLGLSIVAEFASMQLKRLATHVATELAMTQATAAGTAARSGLDWWAATQSIAATAWAAIKNVAAHAAEAAAATYAAVANIPLVGPFLAPAMAAAALATVIGFGGRIASAAGGYDIPPGINPMTQLHAREMVLPASLADRVRGMTDGGGSARGGDTYHVTIHALDGASVERVLRANPAAVAAGVQGAVRQGHLAHPASAV